jgi:osmotically-inducible protein OsmY
MEHWRDDENRRQREDRERRFRNRAGALDRSWGYDRQPEMDEYEDVYNAPDHWQYQSNWMQPGPFTGVGPRGYRRSDERICDEVCERLTQHAQIDARQIEIEVADGEVTVSGTVDDRRIKRMVEANIERIPGVIDVHNRLRLTERAQRRAEKENEQAIDNPFPGGPTPTGNAGY